VESVWTQFTLRSSTFPKQFRPEGERKGSVSCKNTGMTAEGQESRDIREDLKHADAPIAQYIVPAPEHRWVLLHYHLFKNAGSTIEYLLHRTFGARFATLHGPDPSSFLTASDVKAFLLLHPELAAVSSHHLRYPKPVIPRVIIFDLCFFRDPLQRLWSMFKYLQRSEPVDEFSSFPKSMNAQTFFGELLEQHPTVVNDVQVNILANRGEYTRPPSEPDLRIALDYLRQISVLGVVDLFDESALAAEYFLRPTFPTLQFQYVKQNVDPTGSIGLDVEMEQFRTAVGGSIYGELERMNRLDTELVAAARKEVLRRFEMLPNREARVASFRERCRFLKEVYEGLLVPAK
jgi:hypothetical protein